MAATEGLQNGMASLQLSESPDVKPNFEQPPDDEFTAAWGFPLEELYKIALKFYKGKVMILRLSNNVSPTRHRLSLLAIVYGVHGAIDTFT